MDGDVSLEDGRTIAVVVQASWTVPGVEECDPILGKLERLWEGYVCRGIIEPERPPLTNISLIARATYLVD